MRDCGASACGGNILAIGPLIECMVKNFDIWKVTVEVELADPAPEPGGPFESVIKIRIAGTDRHACQMVQEAVLLGIQTALAMSLANNLTSSPTPPLGRPVTVHVGAMQRPDLGRSTVTAARPRPS